MVSLGKILIILGLALAALGIFFALGGKITWFGRLPGDISIHKKNFTIFFPITTSIIISVVLSAILILFRRR